APLGVGAAPGLLLQLVDPPARVGLGQLVVERLARLVAQRLQIRRLRTGHRLVAGLPLRGVLLEVAHLGHVARPTRPRAVANTRSCGASLACPAWTLVRSPVKSRSAASPSAARSCSRPAWPRAAGSAVSAARPAPARSPAGSACATSRSAPAP